MFGHPKTKRGWAHLEAHENDQSGAHGRAPTVVMGPRANKMAKYSASSTTCTNSMNVQAPLYYEPTATRGAGPAAVVVAVQHQSSDNYRRRHHRPANSGVAAAASAAAVSAITSSEGMDSTEDDLHLPFGSDIDGNGEAWNVYIQERGGGDDEL
eukprot:gene11486-15913_t